MIGKARVFKSAENVTETIRKDGDTKDIIQAILLADSESAAWITETAVALKDRSMERTMYNIWNYVHSNIRYRADRPGHEIIRSPGYLFDSGEGDCKSFSIAVGALLRAHGIPFQYRFTAYAPGDVTHIYVIAYDTERKRWIPIDATLSRFNYEAPYYSKKDKKPSDQPSISGAPEAAKFPWLILLLLFFAVK